MITGSREKSSRLDGDEEGVIFYKKKNGGGEVLWELLEIRRGITAVIGGGGKTSLLRTLGEELSGDHRVLLCTTTKMLPYSDLPFAGNRAELEALRLKHSLLCAGVPVPNTGKITAPDVEMALLAEWFDYVLVEADGAARRPMKAHAAHEPVIPPEANQTICVVGASGFGKSIREGAHRPELYAELAGVGMDAQITLEIAAAVLLRENLQDKIYVNQTDLLPDLSQIRRLAERLECPVLAGSLRKGEYAHVSGDSRSR